MTPMCCTGKPRSGDAPPGPIRTEQSRGPPSLSPLAKLLLVQLKRLLGTGAKGYTAGSYQLCVHQEPQFFFLQNCFPSDQTPEYSRSWIYVFLGGGLHTYSLWWTLCGPWPPFLQFFKTLWMAAQHSVVSATPPSFISSTKQVPDPNKHEMDWTRRSLDGQISAQKCLSSTGPGCPAKSPSFLEIFRSYVDGALMGFVQWWPWKF